MRTEKMQTIIARGLANTRIRDFYDVCGIARLNADKIDYGLLVEAFQATCKKRETVFSISEIKDARINSKNGITQLGFAEEIGVCVSNISKTEQGLRYHTDSQY